MLLTQLNEEGGLEGALDDGYTTPILWPGGVGIVRLIKGSGTFVLYFCPVGGDYDTLIGYALLGAASENVIDADTRAKAFVCEPGYIIALGSDTSNAYVSISPRDPLLYGTEKIAPDANGDYIDLN